MARGITVGLLLLPAFLACSCAHRIAPDGAIIREIFGEEEIYSCLNPEIDPAHKAEWRKIDDELTARGIRSAAFSSIGATYSADWEKADVAREIVSRMIRDGKVDADKLQLKVISPPSVAQATQAVARLWRGMPLKDAHAILWDSTFKQCGLQGDVGGNDQRHWFRLYPVSGGCGLVLDVNGSWEDRASSNAVLRSATIYRVAGTVVMRLPLKRREL